MVTTDTFSACDHWKMEKLHNTHTHPSEVRTAPQAFSRCENSHTPALPLPPSSSSSSNPWWTEWLNNHHAHWLHHVCLVSSILNSDLCDLSGLRNWYKALKQIKAGTKNKTTKKQTPSGHDARPDVTNTCFKKVKIKKSLHWNIRWRQVEYSMLVIFDSFNNLFFFFNFVLCNKKRTSEKKTCPVIITILVGLAPHALEKKKKKSLKFLCHCTTDVWLKPP